MVSNAFFRSIKQAQILSCNVLHTMYVDVFYLILRSGKYPSIWRIFFIKPLLKGDCANDPSCYRVIAISSCLGFFFTRILFFISLLIQSEPHAFLPFNHLTACITSSAEISEFNKSLLQCKYLHSSNSTKLNNIICSQQIGFRKAMRTSDHILTLKTLIDKYFRKNKYICACFIDLKKAFDTINRKALLYKLQRYNIRGCFYNIFENMYINVTYLDGFVNPVQILTTTQCHLHIASKKLICH
jgi:hypothetical protein